MAFDFIPEGMGKCYIEQYPQKNQPDFNVSDRIKGKRQRAHFWDLESFGSQSTQQRRTQKFLRV